MDIELENVEPNTHYKLARTDRFHRTLRNRIGEHFERENTNRWIDVLPLLIENYNNTPHTTLSKILGRDASPLSIDEVDEDAIHRHEQERLEIAREETDKLGIVPMKTKVRLLVKAMKNGKDKFSKSHNSNWTTEVYDVLERNGANSWLIDVPAGEVKIYPSYALQIVDEAKLKKNDKLNDKVNVKAERFKRVIAREISEEEQQKNIEAPQRERSQRAKRVDYTKQLK